MKRVFVLALVLFVLFAFAACGGQVQVEDPPELTDRRFQYISNVSEGRVVTMLDEDTIGIVDLFSGEELLRLCADTYQFAHTRPLPDDMVRTWQLDEGRWSLIDILTGDEVLPLREGYSFGASQDGMAVVVSQERGQQTLLDLTTGEEIIPFGRYALISGVYGGMAIVNVLASDEQLDVLFQYGDDLFVSGVIDIVSGEEVIPFGTFGGPLYWHTSACGAMFLLLHCHGEVFGDRQSVGIVDVHSGTEVIPLGSYLNIRMMTEDIAIVLDATPGDWTMGILEISSGTYLVPHGKYSGIDYYNYETGAVFARLDDEEGVFDIVTGEELIPFGYYSRFRFAGDGIMAVSRDDVWWWFEYISDLLDRP